MTTALAELQRIFGASAVSQTTMKAELSDTSALEEILARFPKEVREKQLETIQQMNSDHAAGLQKDQTLYKVSVHIADDSRVLFPQKREDMGRDLEGDGSIILNRFAADMGMPIHGYSQHRARIPHKETRVIGDTEEGRLLEIRPSKDPMKSNVSNSQTLIFIADDIEKSEVIERLKRVNTGQFSYLIDNTLPLADKHRQMEEYEAIRLLNRASGNAGWKVDQVADDLRVFITQEKIRNPKAVIEMLNAALGLSIPMPRTSDNAKAAFETKLITSENRKKLESLSFGAASQLAGPAMDGSS